MNEGLKQLEEALNKETDTRTRLLTLKFKLDTLYSKLYLEDRGAQTQEGKKLYTEKEIESRITITPEYAEIYQQHINVIAEHDHSKASVEILRNQIAFELKETKNE